MDRMHRPLRAGWLLLVLLLIPVTGEAQVVVTEESLASTTDAGLAYARAGIATAGLKLAAAEAERLATEARTADSIARANRAAPATAPMPHVAGEPGERGTSANPESAMGTPAASLTPEAPATEAVTPPATPVSLPPAGPVTEILRARAAQGSRAAPPGRIDATGALETGRPDTPLAADPAASVEEAPPAAAAMHEAPVQAAVPQRTPAANPHEGTLEDAVDRGRWTMGLARAASATATRWVSLFGETANQHPGLMPALLLLMAAAGTTLLALGAGIRPWRRRRSATGAAQGDGGEGESPRPPRWRQEARVPRDVEAVLASLELRTGRPLRAAHPGDPQGSKAPVTRRQA